MVAWASSLVNIWTCIHLVRPLKEVRLIAIENCWRERCPSLSRLLLQFLSPSRIINHRDLARVIDVELTIVDEALNLKADVLSVTEISLKVLISFLKLLDLS